MIHALAIFCSAFLLFLVQPLIAKQIVPWFGGSAGVWTICMLFFQFVLLAGYAWADRIQRFTLKTQVVAQGVLAVIACALLPIVADASWRPVEPDDPSLRILLVLGATIGAQYFLLSTTGPLVQRWFARSRGDDAGASRVYRLFALSNLASLLALIAYPFAVEPWLTLRTQAWAWSAGFVLYAVLVVSAGIASLRRTRHAPSPGPRAKVEADLAASEPIGLVRRASWIGLAALGTTLLLAITTHVTQDVASVPFLWILPLSIYLLSFILCFDSARWYRRAVFWPLAIVLAPALAWGLSVDRGVMPVREAVPLFSAGLFVLCMVCHGELARDRPSPSRLTAFYLAISLGGAIGGLFVGVVAPHVFDGYWELPIALVVASGAMAALARVGRQWTTALATVCGCGVLAALTLWLAPQAHARGAAMMVLGASAVLGCAAVKLLIGSRRAVAGIAAGVSLLASLWYGGVYVQFIYGDTVMIARNFYGVLRVRDLPTASGAIGSRRLMHGVILHGEQYIAPDLRTLPTTYYGPMSGAGLAIRAIERPDPSIGVIGLGTGTVAAYGVAGGRVRYYEINPLVLDTAHRWFTFLDDSQAQVDVEIGDARLVLERELAEHHPQGFDVLVVDAFSSDAIPVHLLTREALAIDLPHMREGGVIAFHVTNRYLDLAPVIRGIAEERGLAATLVSDDPDEKTAWWASTSDYVLVTARDHPLLREPEIVKRTQLIVPVPGMPVWTDDYSNLWKILK